MSAAGGSRSGPGGTAAGLLLWPPAAPPGPGFADELAPVLATGVVAAFVIPAGITEAWRPARDACRAAGVAFLVEDDLDLADALAADGVQLADPAAVPAARGRLGQRRLVGAACGHSRHVAMVAGEEGADYLLFAPGEVAGGAIGGDGTADDEDPDAAADDDPPRTMCAWWTELFLPPCAVDLRGGGAVPDAAAVEGADLVAVDGAVWGHPAGAAAGARELARLLGGGAAPQ